MARNVIITIKSTALDELKAVLTEDNFAKVKNDSRYSSTTSDINLMLLSDTELTNFADWLKLKKARQSYIKVLSYIDVKKDSSTAKIKGLQNFDEAFINIMNETKYRWIFVRDTDEEEYLPWFVENTKYSSACGRGENFSPAVLYFNLRANTKSGSEIKKICFYEEDCPGDITVKEILDNKNILIENEMLLSDFAKVEKRYLEEKHNFNKQYRGSGAFIQNNSRHYYQKVDVVSAKFVNDEEINDKKISRRISNTFWHENDDSNIFIVPCHPFLYVYSLSTYENGYIHISQLEDYVYDDSLRNKLVLPQTHRDLIDILSDDLTILSGDIVEGKSTGTTILCKGVPGTGKTLTAEVYSEITHRPLYKINAGVLGLHYSDIEKNLEDILKRAERWGAVLLIDEADTYIRKRGDDNQQNAVVAAFLRTLEYFNGLLFMTTNRVNDVDDAIESRCIAQILYEIPTEEDAKRIWRVLSDEFEMNVSDNLIDRLVKTFPGVAGRDIKELLRLTGRFCNGKGYELDIRHFISCAQFRGIKAVE